MVPQAKTSVIFFWSESTYDLTTNACKLDLAEIWQTNKLDVQNILQIMSTEFQLDLCFWINTCIQAYIWNKWEQNIFNKRANSNVYKWIS